MVLFLIFGYVLPLYVSTSAGALVPSGLIVVHLVPVETALVVAGFAVVPVAFAFELVLPLGLSLGSLARGTFS